MIAWHPSREFNCTSAAVSIRSSSRSSGSLIPCAPSFTWIWQVVQAHTPPQAWSRKISKFSATSRNDIGSPCPSYGSVSNSNSTVFPSGKNVTRTMPSPAGFERSTTSALFVSDIIVSSNLFPAAALHQSNALFSIPYTLLPIPCLSLPSQTDAAPSAHHPLFHPRPPSSSPAPRPREHCPSSTPQTGAW